LKIPFFTKKQGRRRKVRRLGNLSNSIEIYIYIAALLALLGSVIVSLYK